jgi:hypothetical protein
MEPGFDSKESIPPAYVAWQAGTTNIRFLGIDSWPPYKLKNSGSVLEF